MQPKCRAHARQAGANPDPDKAPSNAWSVAVAEQLTIRFGRTTKVLGKRMHECCNYLSAAGQVMVWKIRAAR